MPYESHIHTQILKYLNKKSDFGKAVFVHLQLISRRIVFVFSLFCWASIFGHSFLSVGKVFGKAFRS